MRFVGALPAKKSVKTFSHYLLSLEIESRVVAQDGQYELWLIKEDRLEWVRAEWQQFVAQPDDAKYQVKVKPKPSNDRALKAHYRKYFKRAHGNQITIALIVIASVCYLIQRAVWPPLINQLLIVAPGQSIAQSWLYSPWRLMSPVLLHFSLFHLLFNVYWLYELGSLIEEKETRFFYVLLLVGAAILGNGLQFLVVGPNFGGLSGVVYGLFAFLWFLSKYRPWAGYYIRSDIAYWMIGWLILGFTGFLGPIANWGHLGGFIAGVLLAMFKTRRR